MGPLMIVVSKLFVGLTSFITSKVVITTILYIAIFWIISGSLTVLTSLPSFTSYTEANQSAATIGESLTTIASNYPFFLYMYEYLAVWFAIKCVVSAITLQFVIRRLPIIG